MKNVWIILLLIFTVFMQSCEVIGEIFRAGFYSGIFLVVLVVGLIIFVISRLSRKK